MLERFNSRLGKGIIGLSDGAREAFASYGWPGNIREMENLLERLVLFAEKSEIDEDLLPDELKNQVRVLVVPVRLIAVLQVESP